MKELLPTIAQLHRLMIGDSTYRISENIYNDDA